MQSSKNFLSKYLFVLLATLIAGYALSYYWHSDNPFNARYHSLNSIGVYSHFMGAGFALLLGGLQVFTKVGTTTHRIFGYGYCLAVVVGALGGSYLALHSYLGWITGLGFFIADLLWVSTTFIAIQQARKGHIRAHRHWIWRSMALTSAGIHLRIMLPILTIFFSFEASYVTVAWLSWLINLIFVEIYFYLSSTRPRVKMHLLKGV